MGARILTLIGAMRADRRLTLALGASGSESNLRSQPSLALRASFG